MRAYKLCQVLFRLALRNLRRHPWRSLATVLGLSLGIAAVLATLSVGDNVRANLKSALTAVTGGAELLVAPGVEGRAVLAVEAVLPKARETPGVAAVTPVLSYRAEPVRDVQLRRDSVVPGGGSGFQLFGRVLGDAETIPAELAAGRWPRPGQGEVALTEDFARQRGLELGQPVAFATPFGEVSFVLVGLMDGGAGLGGSNAGRVGLTALEDLQEAVRLAGRASYLEVTTSEGTPVAEVQARLRTRLGEAYTVTLPAQSGGVAGGVVDTLQAGLRVLAATLMALAAFMAYNAFAAAVLERAREYALLRLLCLTRAQVQRLALLEALVVSALGVALGLLLGVALAAAINRLNGALLGYEVRTLVLPWSSVALASLIGVLSALLAGYLPARAASRTAPLAAVRALELPQRTYPGWGVALAALGLAAALAPWPGAWAILGSAAALGLLFLAVVLLAPLLLPPALALLAPLLRLLFGSAGKLGAVFARRNAARNAVAIGAVALSVTLIVGVGGMVAGINRAIERWVATTAVGDLFVTTPVGFPEAFAARVRAEVEGVDEVSGVGIRVVRYAPEGEARGRSVALVLVDPARFEPRTGFGSFQYVAGQGDAEAGYQALRRGEVLAANTLRERFGLELGDTVSLRTAEGFAPFRVGGVVVDFTGGGEAFIASLELLPRFGGGTPELFVMTLVPGADPEAARAALRERFPDLYLDVSLSREYRQRILSLIQQTFVTTNGLLALAIVIAALGVANTLGMNLSDRQRDIAMLRTLGLSRAGVRRVVLAEGLVLALSGTLLGLGMGVLLARVITAGAGALTGFLITPNLSWPLLALALLAAPLIGVLASILPARRAARLEPAAALGSAL